jgi:hypothetical protein
MKTKHWLYLEPIILLALFLVLTGCTKNSQIALDKHSTSSATVKATDITKTTAQLEAQIPDSTIVMDTHGLVWSTSPNPTYETCVNSRTWYHSTSYDWKDQVTGLKACTIYYVKTYYCHGDTTYYGAEVSFKTPC